jgi:hypothetical protein
MLSCALHSHTFVFLILQMYASRLCFLFNAGNSIISLIMCLFSQCLLYHASLVTCGWHCFWWITGIKCLLFSLLLPFFYYYVLYYCTLVHVGVAYCVMFCYLVNLLLYSSLPVTVAARSKAWRLFARSNAGIVCSNPTRGMDVCVRLFCLCVVLCVGRGLVTDWSSVQGILPSLCKIKKLKKWPRSSKGLYCHIYLSIYLSMALQPSAGHWPLF